MRDHSRDLRDRIVRGLARISLIGVLALMGALFIGSAAVGGTSRAADDAAATQTVEPDQEDILDNVSPVGFMIGVVVIGGGLVVLMFGALKPPGREGDERELADLTRK